VRQTERLADRAVSHPAGRRRAGVYRIRVRWAGGRRRADERQSDPDPRLQPGDTHRGLRRDDDGRQYSHTYAYNAIGNITSYNGNAYTYTAGKPHAVTGAFGNSYGYDAVGNQTSRTIGGTAYTQTFDYDSRLIGVAGGAVSAMFLYDADGNRVKGAVAGVTTVYLAGLYEYQNGASTKYYEGGALRRTGYASDNGVFYVVSDQLHSTSVLINRDGTLNSRNFYYPYGGNRGGGAFSDLTTKRFTGQYHEQGLPGGEGLAYFNARWYDAQVGVFISADTIVPSPLAPQTLNRYAYVSGNPLRYSDPTGHMEACDEGTTLCGGGGYPSSGGGSTRSGSGSSTSGSGSSTSGSGGTTSGGTVGSDTTGSGDSGGWTGDDWTGNGNTTKPAPKPHSLPDPYAGTGYSSRWSFFQAMLIGVCWFTERCSEKLVFGPDASLTQDVRYDVALAQFRQGWEEAGYPVPFSRPHYVDRREGPILPRIAAGGWIYLRENAELAFSAYGLGSKRPEGSIDAVGGVLGSFDNISVSYAGNGYVEFTVMNVTGWSSGTRIPGTDFSLVHDRSQFRPGPGGNLTQYFYWYEQMPHSPDILP